MSYPDSDDQTKRLKRDLKNFYEVSPQRAEQLRAAFKAKRPLDNKILSGRASAKDHKKWEQIIGPNSFLHLSSEHLRSLVRAHCRMLGKMHTLEKVIHEVHGHDELRVPLLDMLQRTGEELSLWQQVSDCLDEEIDDNGPKIVVPFIRREHELLAELGKLGKDMEPALLEVKHLLQTQKFIDSFEPTLGDMGVMTLLVSASAIMLGISQSLVVLGVLSGIAIVSGLILYIIHEISTLEHIRIYSPKLVLQFLENPA